MLSWMISVPCICLVSIGFPFGYKDHNHIKTDNWKIVTNNNLSKRFFKDPKQQENRIDDYKIPNEA